MSEPRYPNGGRLPGAAGSRRCARTTRTDPQLTEAHSRLQDAHAQLCAAEKALQELPGCMRCSARRPLWEGRRTSSFASLRTRCS